MDRMVAVKVLPFFLFLLVLPVVNGAAAELTFPEGVSTPSEACGVCHEAIYREYAYGIGSDLLIPETATEKPGDKVKERPVVSSSATAHAAAPASLHAAEFAAKKDVCNGCHFPEPFAITDLQVAEVNKHNPLKSAESLKGLTCASCHLTPEGKIRGVHAVKAPHEVVVDTALQTSAVCANCHGSGKRVVGKQSQTFLEWREDYFKTGLGKQHCQDCHMPRTLRKVAEEYDVPPRAVARHLWTGAHSLQRHMSSLSLTISQPVPGQSGLSFHVVNIGAGHSVPTGFNPRSVFLRADVVDKTGKVVAQKEWLFAPSVGDRPDDKKYLEEDRKMPNAASLLKADAQGPHEAPVQAGEDRVLQWKPELKQGEYQVKAQLSYSLDRYAKRHDPANETDTNSATLRITAK